MSVKIGAFHARSLNSDQYCCLRLRSENFEKSMMMDNTAIANDFDQELFSELKEPLVQPLAVHVVVRRQQRQELFPANERETFVGMEEVKQQA